MVQASHGGTACTACNPASEFSSQGDVLCQACRQAPVQPVGCDSIQPEFGDGVVWVSVRGKHVGDDCAGAVVAAGRGLVRARPVKLHRGAMCRHTLHVLGRPDLSRVWTGSVAQESTSTSGVGALHVIPYNETTYPALCSRLGFGVLFTSSAEEELELLEGHAVFEVLDPSGEHLLFRGVCDAKPFPSLPLAIRRCHATRFCPTMDVLVRVKLRGDMVGQTRVRVGLGQGCPPSGDWLAALKLQDPFRPFMTDETLTFEVSALNPPPTGFLAFQFLLRIRPGFRFMSYTGNPQHKVQHVLAGDILTVRGDASRDGQSSFSLGRLVLRLEAKHTGQLRPFHVQSFQFMVARGREDWIRVGVQTQGSTCRHDGYLEAWTDFPRVVSLIVQPRRSWLAHWRGVQTLAPVFSTGVDVLGVWNVNGTRPLHLQEGVQCRSLTPQTLLVESCEQITALSVGQGQIRVRFQDQEEAALSVLQVVSPSSVATRFIPDRLGRSGRLQVTAMLLGRAVDVTPFIFSGRVQGGVIWEPDGSVTCSPDYTGNFTVGEPALYHGLCASSRATVVPDLLLLHGDWTARGSFRIGAARLSPESDEAGLVLLGGTGPIHSEDADRLAVAGNGMAQLVRRGRTPRCVALTDSAQNRWMIPVMPPAPRELVVTLTHADLVVQQDVWKLVPSTTRLATTVVRFTDGSSMDVRGRLVWSASQRLRVRDDAAETLHESGPANLTFSLLGTPCMRAVVPVRIHASSVLSATLECQTCPTQLVEHTDPLAKQWPEQFPSAVDGKAFQVRRRLVDGTVHVKQEPLQTTVNGALEEGRLIAQSRGVLVVTSAFTRNSVTMEVLDRWAVDWRVLCNGRVCDGEDLKLAPPGDGAGLPPFRYATRLDLGFELTLLNGTRLTGLDWLPQATLSLNGTEAQLSQLIPLAPGALELRVTLSPDWRFTTLERIFSLRVDALAAFRVVVPPVLYQIHCSRMWERGPVKTLAVLTDGVSAEVSARVEAVGKAFRLDVTRAYLEALSAGEGLVMASFGETDANQTVLATAESKLFTGVALDSIPSVWTAPLTSTRLVHANLIPFLLVSSPARVLRAVVWWQVSPAGIMDITEDGGRLTLLSDHYEPAIVSVFIRGCQGAPPVAQHRAVQVNVVADQAGQVDVGDASGPPLPATPVGETMHIPLYLFAPDRPLLSFKAIASLPGLRVDNCTAGELPLGACSLNDPSSARFTASFPASQRTGRLLLGVLHGRVLLNGLSRLSVAVQSDPLGSSTYEFTVRLGVEPVHSAVSLLNAVRPGFFQPEESAAWDDAEPERLEVCCDVLVTCQRSRIAHLFQHTLSIQDLRLQPAGTRIDLTDPRIQIEYDSLVLAFDRGGGVWAVERDAQEFAETTSIILRYTHPGSQVRHDAILHVTLAKEQALILDPPAPLLLFRIHCASTHFQAKSFQASLLLRGGVRVPLDDGRDLVNATVKHPSIAGIVQPGLVVRGLAPGQTSLVLRAFGLAVESSVHVRGQSVRLRSIRLPDPYVLQDGLEEHRVLELASELEDGQVLVNASAFLFPEITSNGPLVILAPPRFRVVGNTHPNSPSFIAAVIPSCEASGNISARAQLVVRLAPRPPADVVLDTGPLGFQVLLAAESVVSFLVELHTAAPPASSCQPAGVHSLATDCSVEPSGRIRLAGVFAGVQHASSPMPVARVSPMPSSVSGTVEVFTGETVTRLPVVAGHFGMDTPRQEARHALPAVDTTSLARLYHDALAHPWDDEAVRQARLALELLTGRQRLVDARLYANDQELSAMFRVTDRFFRPSEPNETRVEVVFHTNSLPPHPEGRDGPDGVRIAASYVVDGWLAVQFKGPMPLLKMQVTYEVSTNTSLSPWLYKDTLFAGRPVHACPRLATDRASFQVVYVFNGSNLSMNPASLLACTAGVAPRRVVFSGPGHDGLLSASISVESFIRMHEVHQAIMQLTPPGPSYHLRGGKRALLQERQTFTRVALLYVNDTADPIVPCPPGTFYSQNGTYERLPVHAVAGPDCYNMSCLGGYTLLGSECVPSTVSLELAWVCVIVILGVILLVSCILCAVHVGKRSAVSPPAPVDMVSDSSWPGSSHPSEPFFQEDEDDRDFKNIMLGSYLDDNSMSMLDDFEDDFLATSRRTVNA